MNNNFPKLNSANFTITDDFVKDLARPDYRIILFKVYAESQSNGSHEDVFAYCDYIDEDVIVADLPMQVIGNIQARWLTFKYLAIENDNYNAFIKNHQSINSIMSDTSLEWKNAFDRVDIEEGDNNLKVETTGSNYIFFDFSDYNLNCSIQLLNTFDKGDREFIYSHYHSKNTTQPAILATDDYLGYYDDVEYSKLDSDESSGNLRSAIEIENDEFNGSKPSELNLKHKSNFVRMFRPEEYYHMGDFTIKLLGKPLQPNKFKYAPDEADGDTKGSREDLNVLGVTSPSDPNTGNRDLQYVDMYDYNKYLQPIFRNWDKNSNTNPHVITKENPYLFTIKKVNAAIDNFSIKSFNLFFRILTSDELLEVVLSCSIGMIGQPLDSKLSAVVKVTSGHSNSDSFFEIYKDKYSLYYKEVGTSLQIYFDVCDATTKSVLLLEAGIQSYNGTKDETTLIYEEGITGNSGSTKLTTVNFIANTDMESAIAGYTIQPGGSSNPINLWNGELIADTLITPKLNFISLGNSLYDNQYAKLVFSDWNTYCNSNNPWGDSDGGDSRIETSVSLIGGKHAQNQERVVFGTPYLCVTKGMKVCGTSYFSGKVKFDGDALFMKDLTHKEGNSSEKAFITFKAGNSNGDALLIKGLHGSTFLGSGETMSAGDGCDTPWDKLTKIYNRSTNHPDITSSDLSTNDEKLALLSDKSMLFFTNCNNGNSDNYLFEFTEGGNFKVHHGNIEVNNPADSGVDVKVKVKNKNGQVSLHSSTNRGVFDDTKGEWLIASVSNFKGQDNNLQSMTGVYIGAKSDNTYIHKHLTTFGNLTVNGTSTLKGNASLNGTLTVDKATTLKGTTTCNDNVTLSKSGNVATQFIAKNGNANSQVSLHTHSNKGVYDNDAGKWIIAKENSNDRVFTGFNFVPNSNNSLNLGASDRYWKDLYVKNIHASNIEGAVLEWGKSIYAINLTSASPWHQEGGSSYIIGPNDLITGNLKSNLKDGALIIIFYYFSSSATYWFYYGAQNNSTRIILKYNAAGYRERGYYNGMIIGTYVKSTGYLTHVVAN